MKARLIMTKSEITQTPRFLIKGCLSFESTAMFVNCALAAMESTLERRHQFKFDKVLTFMASAAAASDICGKSCDHIIPPAETTSIFKIQPAFKMSFHTFKKLQKARQFSFQGPKLIHVLKTGSFSFVFIKALLDWLNLKVETASAIKSYLKWMSDDPSIAFQNDHCMSPLL